MSGNGAPEQEGFLARWSRRKRQAAEGRPPEAEDRQAPQPAPPPAESAEPAAPEEQAPPQEARAEEDLPDLPPPESLTAESDIRPFLDRRVPAALRQAALRRIWSLDPAIRDFIGPADYAWDYNAPDGGVPGFAPTLGEEARRLLAQAIGLDHPEEPAPAPAPRAAADTASPEAPCRAAGGEAGAPEPPLSPPDAPPLASTLTAEARSEGQPAPGNGEPAAIAAPARSAPRRHGGARPA